MNNCLTLLCLIHERTTFLILITVVLSHTFFLTLSSYLHSSIQFYPSPMPPFSTFFRSTLHIDGHQAINAKTKEPDTLEFSPLHYAVRAGKLELVEALLSHPNIDLDVKDSDGSTPLHYACKYGYEDIVLALRKGNFCLANNEDEYPLHLAATELHRDVFAAVKNDEELVEKLRNSQFASLKNSERNTLLHVVVDSEDMEAVKLCLLLGFDLRAGNIKGFNSLHVAARRGNVAIVNMLLDKERERGEEALHSFVNSRNRYLASSLYLAAKFGQVKVIELLLKKYVSMGLGIHH